MKIVKYFSMDLYGNRLNGSCEYEKLNEIKRKLKEKGLFIYKVSNKTLRSKLFPIKLNALDISILCNKLSIMLDSGIGISKIFMHAEEQSRNRRLKFIYSDIKIQLMQGNSLCSSMEKYNSVFPNYMIEMIGVGEETGNLEKVLKELSKYYEQQYKIYSNLKSALIYPAFTFIMSVCIITFLVSNIIPEFVDIIYVNGAQVPFTTQIVMNSFNLLKNYCIQIILSIMVLIFTIYKWTKSAKGVHIVDTVKIRMPLFGKIYVKIVMLKISSSMKILIFSGVNIIKSLYITSRTLENSVMSEKIKNSIDDIKTGKSISSSFERCGIGNELFIYMLKTGEESGKLELIFAKLESIFAEDVYRNLKRMVKVVEPVIIIFLSIFIGIFIMAAIMPVFNIMDSIS